MQLTTSYNTDKNTHTHVPTVIPFSPWMITYYTRDFKYFPARVPEMVSYSIFIVSRQGLGPEMCNCKMCTTSILILGDVRLGLGRHPKVVILFSIR